VEVFGWLFNYATVFLRSRDGVVGIATGYGLDDREVGVPVGSRIFSSPFHPDRSGVHPASYPVDTADSLPGGKSAGA
jgi:hypothetical protein